jgi:hypothetical protein
MRSFRGWRSRLPLLLVILAIGVVFGLGASNAARADDPPPTTVPTPTLPAPVPAPSPPPPHKSSPPPRSKPSPRRTPAPASTPHIATPTPPITRAPAHVAPAITSRATRVRPKPVRAKAKAATGRERRARATTVKAQQTLGASVAFLTQPRAKSAGTFSVGTFLVILGCALAFACFLIALTPPTVVPWRRAAIFVSQRQLDSTLLGMALLAATLMVYIMNRS